MQVSDHRLCVAPMLDWTDRHCRYFLRLIAPRVRLYTEMVTTGALRFGNVERHLAFDPAEHPVALQLGGSEPEDLAYCAALATRWGYDEINLNVGCPSERVQRGAFGACLMAEPQLVADCVRAMRDQTHLPVTVKHRIGINDITQYAFVRDFVGLVANAGCTVFIVHARNAVLQGLSPKQNREIPPLNYGFVYQLKQEFPQLTIVINGGIDAWPVIETQYQHVDGVMIGRAAYHDPWLLAQASTRVFADDGPCPSRESVALAMHAYCVRHVAAGGLVRHISRHLLGLFHGAPHARTWRRLLSDASQLATNSPDLILRALEAVTPRAA